MKRVKPFVYFAFRWLIVLFILAATFVFGMFQGGFVSWFLFYSVVIVFICSCLVSFLSLFGVKATRHISKQELRTGEEFNVEITISRPRLLPFFYYEASDAVPASILAERHEAIFFFTLKKELRFSYEAKALQRGEQQFGELVVTANDLFGLIRVKKRIPIQTELLVYPAYHYVKHGLGTIGASHVAKQLKKNYEDHAVSGVRPYVAGDRMAQIDWKRSAGVVGLVTKEFETDQSEEISLFLLPSTVETELEKEWFEESVSWAASLAATFVSARTEVVLHTYPNRWNQLPLNERTWKSGLRLLAKVKPLKTKKQAPLPPNLQLLGGVTLLITPQIEENTIRLVRQLEKRKTLVFVAAAAPVGEWEQEQFKRLKAQLFHPQFEEGKRRSADDA
ncbi:hypothetical protein CHH78_14630 [Shouchella clausii]|uniref:DUF58 domain-containing protein n=1 Tax=Shouchella clausii TaxID=79880 RepID=A0A268RUM2_SHOCL|nr:DUF58 domain-containing protein [Shouchella clausii]PAD41006.1 hypothetical protein CHH54_19590 [Bacillus sp. 7520-S]MBU8597768.1 DUF58 domain-containing protein [Shouchella clausii]MCY1106704.1 DUF58 domain-containing protein [Shouchella clausii]MED4160940.1 DUF58 domain-containing protein [Shouchella clausii]MED4176013.1 DUF58 domain-containing protein [Shouchella clausii]